MMADTKAQVLVRSASEVESVRIHEDGRITIRCRERQ